MINNKGYIQIDNGANHITEWIDPNTGDFKISNYVRYGRVIVNKNTTGCGFTSYALWNRTNTIIVSPRLRLIQNKMDQVDDMRSKGFIHPRQEFFYFDRELDPATDRPRKTIDQLRQEFADYGQKCAIDNLPMKIFVTYVSFCNLCDMMEGAFGIDIGLSFQIVVDESHCLIKDVKLAEYNNKNTLSKLTQRLFHYPNLLFISATPIITYLERMDEFIINDVDYYELRWQNVEQIKLWNQGCKSPLDAFDKLFREYASQRDYYGRNYFDRVDYGNGQSFFSYEAVIFLNSVKDINRIIRKYVDNRKEINVSDITVICADTSENLADLNYKLAGKVKIAKSIPKERDPKTIWTFVTRTAFEGVDMYSSNASSYVIANYRVPSLSLDIASDIPQIIGRQRCLYNPFRCVLHIFYTQNLSIIEDSEYQEWQREKMDYSNALIGIWKDAAKNRKGEALKLVNLAIKSEPNKQYLSTADGEPKINSLLIIDEDYCRDILKNQQQWFVMSQRLGQIELPAQLARLRDDLDKTTGQKTTQERIRLICEFINAYPHMKVDLFNMLHQQGYRNISYYFNVLSLDRIRANGYDTWKMDQEIRNSSSVGSIRDLAGKKFESGRTYSNKEVKEMLQDIYDEIGLNKRAKATDLKEYIACEIAKKNGIKAIRII